MKLYLNFFEGQSKSSIEKICQTSLKNLRASLDEVKEDVGENFIEMIEMSIVYAMALVMLSGSTLGHEKFNFIQKNIKYFSDKGLLSSREIIVKMITSEDYSTIRDFVVLNSGSEIFAFWRLLHQHAKNFKKIAFNYLVLLGSLSKMDSGFDVFTTSLIDTIELGFDKIFNIEFTQSDFDQLQPSKKLNKEIKPVESMNSKKFEATPHHPSCNFMYEYMDSDDFDNRYFVYDFKTMSDRIQIIKNTLTLNEKELRFINELCYVKDDISLLNLVCNIYAHEPQLLNRSVQSFLQHIFEANSAYKDGFSDVNESIETWLSIDELNVVSNESVLIWTLLIIMTGYETFFSSKLRSKNSKYEELYFHNYFDLSFIKKINANLDFCKVAVAIDGSYISNCQKFHYNAPELIDIAIESHAKTAQLINISFIEKNPNLVNLIKAETKKNIMNYQAKARQSYKDSPLVKYIVENE